MFKTTLPLLGVLALAGAANASATLHQPSDMPMIVADAGGHGDHDTHGAHSGMAGYSAGELTISYPFSRATLPNAPVAGGFFTVTNNGAEDDRLIGASSAVADHLEVHEMAMDGDVMRMRELKDGLPIPAGETVELKPGGYHIMFMGLNQPLVEGETVKVTLTFEKAGEVEIELSIGAPNSKGHGGMGHEGMGMKHGAIQPLPYVPVHGMKQLRGTSIGGIFQPVSSKAAA